MPARGRPHLRGPADGLLRSQHLDPGWSKPVVPQHRYSVFTWRRRGPIDPGRRGAEARSRGRLDHTVDLDEARAGPVVRMTGRLLHAEHGRHARIGVLEVGGPFIPGAGAEDLGEPGLGLGPATLVVLRFLGLRLQTELADQG